MAISFYHWKSNAVYSKTIAEALQKTKAEKIYLHFFDVDTIKERIPLMKMVYSPVYALKHVDPEYAQYPIVPVVYIVNHALKNATVKTLSERIHHLIEEISKYRFKKSFHEIQLDCDWTASTRENYFQLIRLLQKYYTVSVTIRLHQVKFRSATGVPPVEQGTLMLYNMGDLENENQNSILDPSIVSQYIGPATTYPIDLEVALPLFSQTVLINNNHQLRILNGAEPDSLQSDGKHFRALDQHLFEVLKDTLYKGFYLSPGYRLKTEEVTEMDILAAYATVKQSRMNLTGIVFYSLDEDALRKINLDRILNQL